MALSPPLSLLLPFPAQICVMLFLIRETLVRVWGRGDTHSLTTKKAAAQAAPAAPRSGSKKHSS